MALPFFYEESINSASDEFVLGEDTSKHIVQVLRMHTGQQLQITDGNGNLFIAEIIDHNKKKCGVKILATRFNPTSIKKITLAISIVKNIHRFEWFLEKATEIGINEIVPLICVRTEKQQFRFERMKNILISAMLQSQQTHLPFLHEPIKFQEYVKNVKQDIGLKKFIAHCEEGEDRIQLNTYYPFPSAVILIGPEGDFTIDEIELALQKDFVPVALGYNRLRTETAGIVAATILNLA